MLRDKVGVAVELLDTEEDDVDVLEDVDVLVPVVVLVVVLLLKLLTERAGLLDEVRDTVVVRVAVFVAVFVLVEVVDNDIAFVGRELLVKVVVFVEVFDEVVLNDGTTPPKIRIRPPALISMGCCCEFATSANSDKIENICILYINRDFTFKWLSNFMLFKIDMANNSVQPDVSKIPVPVTAGTGEPNSNAKAVAKNSSVSSGSVKQATVENGPFSNLNAKIENRSGFDMLKFHLAPGASVITNQDTLSYMDGGLTTEATTGSGGFFSAILRGFTGSSMLQNMVVNSTQNKLQMVLSPLTQGSIVQIEIKAGETWRFADKSFIACTPNLSVSGNMNVFSNFRLMFVGENVVYTTITAQNEGGLAWVSAYGALEIHDIKMGTGSSVPLFINNGCFLGMIDRDSRHNYWEEYVSVGTAQGLLNAMFTQIGFVMKIQDSIPSRGVATCRVLTQSLNPHNFEKYVSKIAQSAINNSRPAAAPMQSQGFFGFGLPSTTYSTSSGFQGSTTGSSTGSTGSTAGTSTAGTSTAGTSTAGIVPQNTANGYSSNALFGPPPRNSSESRPGSNSGFSLFRGGRTSHIRKIKKVRQTRRK